MMDDKLFQKMAQQLSQDRAYNAYFIALILEQDDLSWEALAQRYGMTTHALAMVGLCRRPREAEFQHDVQAIATLAKVDLRQVVSLVRYGEGLDAIRRSSDLNDQSLAAARDRDDED